MDAVTIFMFRFILSFISDHSPSDQYTLVLAYCHIILSPKLAENEIPIPATPIDIPIEDPADDQECE